MHPRYYPGVARSLSPEKRELILRSAIQAIAENGLAASTAAIAKGAALAEGTMFRYFASKEELLNELYLTLKSEAFGRIQTDFPKGAPLRERARHVWIKYLEWATERPAERRVAMLLHLSTLISSENRGKVTAELGIVAETQAQLAQHGVFKALPPGFAASAMKSLQEAVLETPVKNGKERAVLFEKAFEAFWLMAE